jgi:phosphate transport system substrate-binding protein
LKKTLVAVILLASFSLASAANITIKGSDTLVRLGQRWAEVYMKAHPDAVIQVSGGGTGTGIAALINGTTDICEASRDMKKKEYDEAAAKDVKPFRVAVALDGIAVFLNEANPVKELPLGSSSIYRGAHQLKLGRKIRDHP